MESLSVRGIILKQYDYKEYDKNLILFVKDHGKLSIMAKSAKKPKSKFLSLTENFIYADFYVYKKGDLLFLRSVDLIESFHFLRYDLDRLHTAFYLSHIVDQVAMKELSQNDLLYLFICSLHYINQDQAELKKAKLAFLIKFTQLMGYDPFIVFPLTKDSYFYMEDGIVTSKPSKAGGVRLTFAMLQTMQYVTMQEGMKIFSFHMDPHLLTDLLLLLERYLVSNCEIKFLKKIW